MNPPCILFMSGSYICNIGVDDAAARTFVSAFYSCMSRNAEMSTDTYAGLYTHDVLVM